MIVSLIILLLIAIRVIGMAQDGSDIPIIVAETIQGFPIPDEPKIKAQIKIIDHGPDQHNYPGDSGNVYHGNARLEASDNHADQVTGGYIFKTD